jgi:hypothetical protein
MAAQTQRKSQADVYRPVGPKQVSPAIPWVSGGGFQLSQQVDLSLPLKGFRFVLTGRLVVGTSGVTTISPEGFLNLISNVTISGTNARQKGNITLWSVDLATAYAIQHLTSIKRAAYYSINPATGEVQTTEPSTPWPADNNPTNATGTYDFRIVVDFPLHPFADQNMGNHPHWIPAYLMRNEEWKDSVLITATFPTVVGGAVAGPFGTPAAGTTFVFSGYGSGAGTPTVAVYSLPVIMGMDLKDGVFPGVLSRVSTPINTPLVNAGSNVTLLNMQKQPTTRLYFKSGAGTAPPAFASLNDTNVTALGISLGGNRNVRNLLDIYAHKGLEYDTYTRNYMQGYFMFDFMDSGNPDSGYPGQDIGDGATFAVVANVVGLANAQGVFVQEQSLHTPTGALYTF